MRPQLGASYFDLLGFHVLTFVSDCSHAMLVDQETERVVVPLNSLSDSRKLELANSECSSHLFPFPGLTGYAPHRSGSLSEMAVLGVSLYSAKSSLDIPIDYSQRRRMISDLSVDTLARSSNTVLAGKDQTSCLFGKLSLEVRFAMSTPSFTSFLTRRP